MNESYKQYVKEIWNDFEEYNIPFPKNHNRLNLKQIHKYFNELDIDLFNSNLNTASIYMRLFYAI